MSTVYQQSFKVNTNGFTDILDITEQVTAILQDSKKQDGIINVFVVGSTAGITTIELKRELFWTLRMLLSELLLWMQTILTMKDGVMEMASLI